MNPNYRLVALDMDGTLLTPEKTIDPATARDIALASEHGVQAVFCTGRAVPELRDYFGMVPQMRYAVCNSGAVVYDCTERKCLFRSLIPHEMLAAALAAAEKYRAMLHFLTEDESIVSASDVTHMADFHMGIYQTMFQRVARPVESVAQEAARHGAVAKINLYFRSPEERSACFQEMRQLPLVITLPEVTTLEMTAQGVSKASGLSWLAEMLGIPMEQVIGIGDSDNDREMLRSVGLSIAMGNASADIQAQCGMVTADNAHNGAGRAIRRALAL